MEEIMFSKDELNLVKGIFGANDKLIKIARKFFFQGELTEDEKKKLGIIKSMGGLTVLKKFILPEIDPESPLFQFADLFISVNTKDRDVEYVAMEIESRKIMIDYFKQQFERLENDFVGETAITLNSLIEFGTDGRENHLKLGARNAILSHIDFHFQQIKLLANAKEETEAQKEARQNKDSAK